MSEAKTELIRDIPPRRGWPPGRGGAPDWLRGALAVVLGLAVAAVAAIALNVKVSHFRESQALIEQTDLVLAQIATVDRQFTDSGIAERGYLILGGEQFRDAYKKLWIQIPVSLNTLQDLLADDSEQLLHLDDVRQVISERSSMMDDIIAMGPEKLHETITVLRGSRMLQLSGLVLNGLETMRVTEQRTRKRRAEEASRQVAETALLAGVTSILAIFSAAFAALLFLRQSRRHTMREARSARVQAAQLRAIKETESVFARELARPLAVAMNYLVTADMSHDQNGSPKSGAGVLHMATAHVEQAIQIANRLREHGGESGRRRSPEDIEAVIAKTVAMLDVAAEITVECDGKLPPVLIDEARIQQVLVKLIENAARAMERSARREITVSVSAADDRMIRVQVRDTGPGVSAGAAARLFEPFATALQTTMGLGLAISLNIVQAHGGKIWLESNSPAGAIFSFTVPIAADAGVHEMRHETAMAAN